MATTVRPRPNHYETLGLKPGASNDEIVRAFARQMSMFRPMTDAAQISIAYDVLHNPAKRHAYDEEMGFNRPQEPRQVRFTVTGGAGARFVGSTLPPMPPSAAPTRPAPPPVMEPQTEARPPERAPGSFIAAALRGPARPAEPQVTAATPREPHVPVALEPKLASPMPTSEIEEVEAENSLEAWRRPALMGGGAVLAVALIGAWAGLHASDPEPAAAAADPAVSVSLPPAKPAPSVTTQGSAPVSGFMARPSSHSEASTVRRSRAGPPTQDREQRIAEIRQRLVNALEDGATVTAAAEPAEQPVQEAATAEAVPASLPLSNATVARTIERIGYACGQVASTDAVGGNVFKVNCTSGQSYQAKPVRGRYHFRRWGRD